MEPEKDLKHPEKDSKHPEKDSKHPEKQAADKSYEKKDDSVEKNTSQPVTPTEIENSKTDDVKAENNDEKMKEEEEKDEVIEEAPPPTFDQASEQMDKFILALSSLTKEDQSELPKIPEAFEHFANYAMKSCILMANLSHYDQQPEQQPGEESDSFLESLDRVSKLTKALSEFPSDPEYARAVNRVGGILHRAMCYLEDEFRNFLEEPKFVNNQDKKEDIEPANPETPLEEQSPKIPTVEDVFPGYTDSEIKKLNELSYAMINGGYGAECHQAYIIARRTILEISMHKLGFEKLSLDEIHKMQWEALEGKVINWKKTIKEFLSIFLSSERKLAQAVFSHDKSLSDNLFSSITVSMTIQLFNFAEAVAITNPSSQKLFKFIDIYETLRDAISTMDSLFPEETANELKAEALTTHAKLGVAMVLIFNDLEISIKTDTGKNNVPGGAVHPLTRYTLNYLQYVCEYTDTLEQVFNQYRNNEGYDEESNKFVGQSPFAQEINKVMDLLDGNLDSKSKLYKDVSLSAIFMMNNGRYILQKMKGSSVINGLMGGAWTRKRSTDLRNFHKTYQRETWNRLLNCLSPDGLTIAGKVMKPILKEKFKSFNAMFDEIHKTQSTWVVSDEQLQSELRVSIAGIVIPAYRSFLARFAPTFTPGRQTQKYVKYQPEDIENCIDELFDGNSNIASKRRL